MRKMTMVVLILRGLEHTQGTTIRRVLMEDVHRKVLALDLVLIIERQVPVH